MLDPHFRRSVVVVTEHREEGTMGFIMNKKLDARLNDVVSDFPDFDAPLYYGGPLANNTIHYLHNVGDLLEGSTRVSSGVYSGGSWARTRRSRGPCRRVGRVAGWRPPVPQLRSRGR